MTETFQKLMIVRNVLFGWCCLVSIYFLIAEVYLWRMTGVNMWKVWWQTNTSSLKTERRFAQEIKQFPRLNLLYQAIKWITPIVVLSCMIFSLMTAWKGR